MQHVTWCLERGHPPYARHTKKGKSAKRIKQLQELGFVWDLDEDQFDSNLSLLKEYKEEEGHCNVPKGYKKGTVAWNVGTDPT